MSSVGVDFTTYTPADMFSTLRPCPHVVVVKLFTITVIIYDPQKQYTRARDTGNEGRLNECTFCLTTPATIRTTRTFFEGQKHGRTLGLSSRWIVDPVTLSVDSGTMNAPVRLVPRTVLESFPAVKLFPTNYPSHSCLCPVGYHSLPLRLSLLCTSGSE